MEEQNDGRELDKPDEKQFIYENGPHGSVCFLDFVSFCRNL